MKQYYNIIISLIAVIFTIWYMHFGNLTDNSGALSKTGLVHPLYFAIWGILTYVALGINISILCKKLYNTKLYIPPLFVSAVGMILTLSCDFDYDKKLQYYLHCIGSMTFSIVMSITIFLIFCLSFKKSLFYKSATIIIGIILITDLILLIIFKETALIEAIPILIGIVITSYATLLRDGELIEVK